MIADSFQTSSPSHRSSFAIAARWSRDVQAKSAGRFQMRPGATPRGGDGGVCDVEVGRGCRGKCFLRAPWKRQGTGEWVRDPSAMPLSQSLSLRLAAGRVGRMMCGWVVSLVWFLAGAGGVSGLAGGLLVSSSSGQAADTAEASTRLAQARRQQQ